MQSVLSPIVGRLSDVVDRKYLATIPPLIAFVGAVVSAKATSMSMLIGGGILIGTTLSTIAIVQAIPAEVLPLKYRALANGFAFLGGAVGGLIGVLGAGGVTNVNASGWRDIFWIQAAFHLATSLGLLFFYHPKRRSDYPKLSLKGIFWACDPIGSFFFVSSAALLLLALDWAGGAYAWSDAHVAAPLGVGFGMLVLFCLYGEFFDSRRMKLTSFRMERKKRWSCCTRFFQGISELCAIGVCICCRGLVILQCCQQRHDPDCAESWIREYRMEDLNTSACI